MKIIQREVAVAAGAVNDNAFTGSAFEFPPTSLVQLGVVASATGTFITVQAGGTVVMEESPPAVKTTFPVIPDEFYYTFAAVTGDRLVLRLRNPTGGAITFRIICQIQEA